MSRKILIAYYSQSGNTEKLAKMIQNEVGGALYSIGDENAGSAGVEAYDTFFVGTPNWSGTLTAPVKEFLSKNDLSGKNRRAVLHAWDGRSAKRLPRISKSSVPLRPC